MWEVEEGRAEEKNGGIMETTIIEQQLKNTAELIVFNRMS